MKKLLSTVLIAILAVASVFALAACTPKSSEYFDGVYAKYENLAANAVSYDSEGKVQKSFRLKGKAERRRDLVTVDLGAVKEFNTITLRENGTDGIIRFSIYASNDGEKYEFLYQSDTIECGHVCFVGDVSYRYLRIMTTQVKAKYDVDTIGVYMIKSENAKKLRNTGYLVINDVDENYDLSTLDAFTDIILFSTATFQENGDITFSYGKDGNGNEVYDNGERYAQKLSIVREKLAGRDVNLIADVYLPYGKVYEMMSNHRDNAVANIKALLDRFDLDGYDIDYEYPTNKKEWKAYNEFLVAADKAIGDKILSIATSPFALKFDDAAIAAIDRVQYMVYDCFDSNGYQSTIPTAVAGVYDLLECGFTAEKIDLGVPTYSRPIDGYEYWGNYKDFVDKLGRYDNLLMPNDFDHDGQPLATPQYFNSYQTILDKTAFAIDAGLGGIMMFRIGCDTSYDNPLCLAKAVVEAKAAKAV